MATIKCFTELDSWQKARKICKRLVLIANDRIEFRRDRFLYDQMRRSSGSIMDNIAEGFYREGNKEFILFLGYAKGSCGELKSQLFRAQDFNYITVEELTEMQNEIKSINRLIFGLQNYLKKSEIKGMRFKEPQD